MEAVFAFIHIVVCGARRITGSALPDEQMHHASLRVLFCLVGSVSRAIHSSTDCLDAREEAE